MLDVLWTPLVVFSLWSYIGLNIFRYKMFEYKDEGKKLSLFILFRFIVVFSLVVYMFLSFNDYVFYCQIKLFFFFVSIIGIVILEFIFSIDLVQKEDVSVFFTDFLIWILYILCNAVILFLVLCCVELFNKKEVEPKITTYQVITTKQEEKNSNTMFGIQGVASDSNFSYSFFYYVNEGKNIEHKIIDESDLAENITILPEGESPYVEELIPQYVNVEEINKTVKENKNGNITYRIFTPLSELHGDVKDEDVNNNK